MADFTALKTAIQTYIKQNGNEEITGNILQEILLSVVTTLGDTAINNLVTALADEVAARQNADVTLQQNITNEATARGNADTALQGLINGVKNNVDNGYVYAGIATPSSTPTTGKVFYLALTAGTYTNFGSTEVSQGINILKYNGSTWSLDAFIGIDDAPTPNSPKLVKSGGAFDSVMTNGSAFDISAHFASGGTLATYADLNAALTALNTLSAPYKRGGMSIKFVQSSDDNYVQFRCMAQSFTTDVTKWQKTFNGNTYEFIDGSETYLNLFKSIVKDIYFFGADITNGKQVRVSYIGTNHPNLGGNNYLGLQLAFFLPNDNTEKRVNFIALANAAAQNELLELKPESGNYDNLGLYIKTTDTFSWNSDQIIGSVDILLTSNAVGDNNEAAIQYSIKRATESEWLDVGNGYSYTSILRALKETNKNLLVHTGNYDIYNDYINYYGADFWTNYTDWDATDLFKAGLYLAPNRKIRFEANTYLIFDAQTNNNVKNRFSLFFLSYNNSIEYAHMMIENNSLEYFIHDDYSNYVNAKGTVIKGCIFNGTPYGNACIGGGCGTNNIYTIEDCIFLNNNGIHDISYHNTTAGGTNNRCKIFVNKCFGSKKCAFRSYGESIYVTDCIVTGCKFGEITCYVDAGQPNENMRLFKFNNTETDIS